MTRLPQPKVNEQVALRDFKYYIFDWDDNILHMPTRIHLEKRQPDGTWKHHSVSTSVFSIVRQDTANYRPLHDDREAAFIEFQDDAPDGDRENRFVRDTEKAIARVLLGQEPPGPSFTTFRRMLVEGRLFAIVTARGHASGTLRKGVESFINLVLTPAEREEMLANLRGYRWCFDGVREFGTDSEEIDYYLGLNRYHAVTNPDFKAWMDQYMNHTPTSEERKQFAIRDFVEHLFHVLERMTADRYGWRPISIGFSDDDPANVAAVQKYIEEALGRRFPNVRFCVYDTSDPSIENGRKVTVSGQLDLGL